MSTQRTWIFVALLVLLSVFFVDVRRSYAQEDEVVAKQVFTVRSTVSGRSATDGRSQACTVTAELRWYKKKQVKVLYHWQACSGAYPIRWELASIHNAAGAFTISAEAGELNVYKDTWPDLSPGDQITLHTWINEIPQPDVVTAYRDASPIWTKIHTRQDEGGACFQFTGHIDPWGVFTAGDQRYVFELSTDDWTTPWVAGPPQPTVDWHVQFYKDAALTQLRNEYWFNNVPNPCYSEPPVCESITLSIANGAAIPEAGADVEVTIKGQHGSQYRIVDQQGQVVAGPAATPTLTFHAMPGIGYQAQVYRDGYGWTTTGCQFQYNLIARPVCHGVTLNPTIDFPLPTAGQTVQVTINGENGSLYRVVSTQDGAVVAGPDASNALSFHALPSLAYQAQIYSESYGWTTDGCTFQYQEVRTSQCIGVTQNSHADRIIPQTGADVQVTVQGENAVQYRIFDDTNNQIIAGPGASPSFALHALPFVAYQGQVQDANGTWSGAGCDFSYITPPVTPVCEDLSLSVANGATIPADGADVTVTVKARDATHYRLVDEQGNVVAGPSRDKGLSFHAMPAIVYQAQVADDTNRWTAVGCQFKYNESVKPICQGLDFLQLSPVTADKGGVEIEATIRAENASRYQIVNAETGAVVAGPSTVNLLRLQVLFNVLYQAQVANESYAWTNEGCYLIIKPPSAPICKGLDLSLPTDSVLPTGGAEVEVAIHAENATIYRIVSDKGDVAGPGSAQTLRFHAMPNTRYQAQVANEELAWTNRGCDFSYRSEAAVQAFCKLEAIHYGDPGGLSTITAWVDGQTEPVAIERIEMNWDNEGSVTYPTKRQPGPWFTNTPFVLDSRPEVHDVGFGPYTFEAWVYVAGIDAPAYCWDTGNAPDHDNVLPDPGPFAQANPEGKFNRGNTPSRLPTVGRLPFDGGNGPDKVELILWAFEKEGHGVNARITAIANEGKPLARLGMASVRDQVKFDGLPARDGIVYGFQIGEHGPWSPLFCPKADSNPTTITVYWAAGGQTWLSDAGAFGDCWWLTVAAALNGWVTVDETVATYNALQPVIDWHGHRNLVFSLAQSRETGLGPRMQDAVIGLQARQWQGSVIPAIVPPDFQQVVDEYHATLTK